MAKLTKADRLALLRELDELNDQICDTCKKRNMESRVCQCKAALRLREIGAIMGANEVDDENDEDAMFCATQYVRYKDEGLTDDEVARELGVGKTKLVQWKSRVGLTRSNGGYGRGKYLKPVLNGLDVKTYKELSKSGLTDVKIRTNYNITKNIFDRWKRFHITQGGSDMVIAKEFDDTEKEVENAEETTFKYELDQCRKEIQVMHREAHEEKARYDKLRRQYIDLEVEHGKLENDFRRDQDEIRRLRGMLEKLKDTAQMNIWLMKQHVAFHEQLDEVTK